MTNPVRHIAAWQADFTAVRRDLHMHPELGFEEHRTAKVVCEHLSALGIVIRRHRAHRRGRRGAGPQHRERALGGPARRLTLPMQEENAFAHKSRYDGRMHGCGHDGHTTMLLAAARYLHETRAFDGTAYLIFQPGEEGYAGAKEMIADGLCERIPAGQLFALHNGPGLPPGRIGITQGRRWPADRISITIDGKGGTARIRTRRSTRCWSRGTSSPRRNRS
jgi:hippurate hydrolase